MQGFMRKERADDVAVENVEADRVKLQTLLRNSDSFTIRCKFL